MDSLVPFHLPGSPTVVRRYCIHNKVSFYQNEADVWLDNQTTSDYQWDVGVYYVREIETPHIISTGGTSLIWTQIKVS